MKGIPTAAFMALLMATACGVDFSDPVGDTAADLLISVSFVDSLPTGVARVSGSLVPGLNGSGHPRDVPDASLQIAGRAIAPASVNAEGRALYAASWEFDPAVPPGPVTMEAPAIPELESPPILTRAPVWRSGSNVLAVTPGEPLRLPLAYVPAPEDTVLASWTLTVSQQGTTAFTATGTVPIPFDVPAAWLAGLGSGEARARLTVTEFDRAVGRYGAGLVIKSQVVWTLMVP